MRTLPIGEGASVDGDIFQRRPTRGGLGDLCPGPQVRVIDVDRCWLPRRNERLYSTAGLCRNTCRGNRIAGAFRLISTTAVEIWGRLLNLVPSSTGTDVLGSLSFGPGQCASVVSNVRIRLFNPLDRCASIKIAWKRCASRLHDRLAPVAVPQRSPAVVTSLVRAWPAPHPVC